MLLECYDRNYRAWDRKINLFLRGFEKKRFASRKITSCEPFADLINRILLLRAVRLVKSVRTRAECRYYDSSAISLFTVDQPFPGWFIPFVKSNSSRETKELATYLIRLPYRINVHHITAAKRSLHSHILYLGWENPNANPKNTCMQYIATAFQRLQYLFRTSAVTRTAPSLTANYLQRYKFV